LGRISGCHQGPHSDQGCQDIERVGCLLGKEIGDKTKDNPTTSARYPHESKDGSSEEPAIADVHYMCHLMSDNDRGPAGSHDPGEKERPELETL
jgi:hypothetical protein